MGHRKNNNYKTNPTWFPNPGRDSFRAVSIDQYSPAEFENLLKSASPNYFDAAQNYSVEEELKTRKRKERLLQKIWKAAVEVLTEKQFRIFVMRYIYGLKETEIANCLGNNQSLIPLVLRECHKKIRRKLRVVLEEESKIDETETETEIE